MNSSVRRRAAQHGLTLIELMVAMSIGLMLLVGTASLFISNKRIYREQEELSKLQDSARFAMDTIIADLRMSRYAGCSNNFDAVENDLDGADDDDFLMSFANGIEGSESGAPWEPSDAALGLDEENVIPNTDAITIRFLEPTGFNLNADLAAESDPAVAAGTTETEKGDLLALTDCESSDVFEATQVTTAGGNDTIRHVTGTTTGDSPGNADDEFSKRYSTDAELARFYARRYYIGDIDDDDTDDIDNDAIGNPALKMVQNYDQPLELAEGVENMQIRYGEDTDTTKSPIPTSRPLRSPTGPTWSVCASPC